jgi:hypothetical protein
MLALRLMAGQRQLGGWDYTCQALSGADQQELARLLESRPLADTWRDEMFSTLPGAPPAVEQPRFGQPRRPGGRMEEVPVVRWQPGEKLEGRAASREDNSLTQFAILALWAARKHGVPVERSLAFVEARFRTFQNADGTWGYMLRQSNHRDSMTCSGLLGLAVGRGLEKKKAEGGEVRDPALEKALGHVGRVVGRKQLTPEERAQVQARLRELLTRRARATTPQERQALEQELTQVRASLIPPVSGRMVGAESYGDLYFLWSLERMAVVWDLKTIAGKDWYAWGAEVILKAQQPGGQWQETHGPVADTCFALLFLKRVNVVQDLTARLRLLGKVKDPGHLNPDRP